MNKLTKEYIKENLFNKSNNLNTNKLKKILIPSEYNWCESKSEYIYAILNNITQRPLCEVCKENRLKYVSSGEYKEFCSTKCVANSNKSKRKKIETSLKKYGVENPSQSEQVKEKSIQTNLKKYGKEFYFQTDEFKEKQKNTFLLNYSVDNPMKNEKIKNKIKLSHIKKWGVEHPMQNEQFKNEVIKKRENNNLLKNKTKYFSQNHLKNIDNLNKEYIENHFIKNNILLINEYCQYFNFTLNTAYSYLREFNIKYKRKTQIEEEINIIFNKKFVIENNSLIKPFQIDLLSLNYGIGIEYNGLNYHSFGKSKHSFLNNFREEYIPINNTKYKNYQKHLMKTNLCEDNGIQLFHIFENEWIDPIKKNIWISMISSKLKENQIRIYARKTYVKLITKKQEIKTLNEFLIKNHLQGKKAASVKIGLFEKETNQLLSVMTFSKPRYNNNYEYELIRFASLKNHIIVGGASKLLKFFENKFNPKSLISYGNRRWTYSKNNVYEKLGFSLIKKSTPNFFYFKNKNELESRITFQKHKLKEKLDFYDTNLSSYENIYNSNYRRIWDSGNLVYIKYY